MGYRLVCNMCCHLHRKKEGMCVCMWVTCWDRDLRFSWKIQEYLPPGMWKRTTIKISCWENLVKMDLFCNFCSGQQCGFEVILLMSMDLPSTEFQYLPCTAVGMFPSWSHPKSPDFWGHGRGYSLFMAIQQGVAMSPTLCRTLQGSAGSKDRPANHQFSDPEAIFRIL